MTPVQAACPGLRRKLDDQGAGQAGNGGPVVQFGAVDKRLIVGGSSR